MDCWNPNDPHSNRREVVCAVLCFVCALLLGVMAVAPESVIAVADWVRQ